MDMAHGGRGVNKRFSLFNNVTFCAENNFGDFS